ncbi:pilin [Ramlibacter sp. USB13]|uniref:Pilin n=1 Tax=Ramlibacter cellulosilyticus TaxID=2764187 RepID=A0A923MP82_9BURK|nr:pilin [Ramlibacter cellulosilyticus]MBC5782723.1 pilin [Ramlibacter cellulosilyticus]
MGRRNQAGFSIVEVVITACVVAVLSSVALTQYREFTRRAKVSEVVLAGNQCKTMVSEAYPVRDTAPPAGGWGCETASAGTKYAGAVRTSSNGVIRVTIENVEPLLNGRHVFFVPSKPGSDAGLVTPNDLGVSVRAWICGSDWEPARNSLPANCRIDTTTFASDDFE